MKIWQIAAGMAVVVGATLSMGLAPAPTPLTLDTTTYKIDTTHSMALFRVQHFGAGRFYGRFNDVSGEFTFDDSSAESLKFNVTVAIESVDTGNAKLDGHLKSPDFFDARTHPTMTFVSKSAKHVRGAVYSVTGDLAIHGVTKTVTVDVEWTGTSNQRGQRCGFETIFDVRRSEFGMSYGIDRGALGDETRIIVSLEGTTG